MGLYVPPHKISLLSLAVAAALSFSNFSIASNQVYIESLVEDFPTFTIEVPAGPDFSDNTGFEIHEQPLDAWGDDSSHWTVEQFDKTIQNAKGDVLFNYTHSGSYWSTQEMLIVENGENLDIDVDFKDLRLYEDSGRSSPTLIDFDPNSNLHFNNVGSFELFSTGAFSLISQGAQGGSSSFSVNAKRVWLQNTTSRDPSSHWIINAPNSTLTNFDVQGDFVAWLNVAQDPLYSSITNVINANNLNISAKNIFVQLNNEFGQKINAQAFHLYSGIASFGSESSPIGIFSIKGTQTGIFSDSELELFANQLILELDSEHSAGGSQAGFGINLQRASNINVGQFYVSGAHTGIRPHWFTVR